MINKKKLEEIIILMKKQEWNHAEDEMLDDFFKDYSEYLHDTMTFQGIVFMEVIYRHRKKQLI